MILKSGTLLNLSGDDVKELSVTTIGGIGFWAISRCAERINRFAPSFGPGLVEC